MTDDILLIPNMKISTAQTHRMRTLQKLTPSVKTREQSINQPRPFKTQAGLRKPSVTVQETQDTSHRYYGEDSILSHQVHRPPSLASYIHLAKKHEKIQ